MDDFDANTNTKVIRDNTNDIDRTIDKCVKAIDRYWQDLCQYKVQKLKETGELANFAKRLRIPEDRVEIYMNNSMRTNFPKEEVKALAAKLVEFFAFHNEVNYHLLTLVYPFRLEH